MQAIQFDPKACQEFVEQEFMNSALPSLEQYIKIQNMSKGFYKEDDWKQHGWDKLKQAAVHIQAWVKEAGIIGCKTEIIEFKEENLTPIIFTQIQGDIKDTTFFFYGHYDKQPPCVGWNEGLGAYTPVITNDQNGKPEKLYGRGGADDGYSTYGSMLAIKALQKQGIPIPRCVMITEGDEESGSGDVEEYVKRLKDRIGNPKLIFCLDSGTLDYERFWLTTSLRGFVAASLRVDVLKEGVHSGSASGIIPNPFRITRQIIERIQNQYTGDMIKEFNVNIPPNRYKELYDLAQQKGEEVFKGFGEVDSLQRMNSDVLQSLILNGWSAQLAVIAAKGLPDPIGSGNVLLPYTETRLSIRLPPTKNHEEAKKILLEKLQENPPYNAKIEIIRPNSAPGFNAPEYKPSLEKAIYQSSTTYFGKPPLSIAQGGSIPFMHFLQQNWPEAQFIVTGVLGPASNAHGPNEFLHIPYVKSLICSIAHILANTSKSL